MLRIWGRISSINVRKVVLAAQLLNVPFERVDAGQAFGVVQMPEYKEKNPNALVPLLALLDKHLAHQSFMAGERLTMADIPIACEIHRWLGLPLEHRSAPHLDRWYRGMLERPAARGLLDLTLS